MDEREIGSLADIEQRVLWLATSMIHHANRVRPNATGLKVGGHQASCASMVSIMTALWFDQLRPGDRVAVKPHASPVLHAINYLLGELDESYLTRLREFGGLQSYPSRTKDPDPVDYSTGSVGIGATAPIWGAVARRYVETTFGGAGKGRQYSLVGDAELDEGAVWEAILDPSVAELGEDRSVRKVAIAFKESRRLWFRDLLVQLGVADAEALATQLALLVDGSIAQDLVRNDPAMARAAKEAATVLLKNAGVKVGGAAPAAKKRQSRPAT